MTREAVVVTTIKKLMHLIVIVMYLENLKEHRYDKVGTTDAVPTSNIDGENPTSHGCCHICPQWTQAQYSLTKLHSRYVDILNSMFLQLFGLSH